MIKYNVSKLRDIFESKLDTFNTVTKRHYAERLYRITGDKKFIPYIKNFVDLKKDKIVNLVSIVDNREALIDCGIRMLGTRKIKKKDSRKDLRRDAYAKFPEFKYYRELVWYLDRMNDYGQTKIIGEKKQKQVIKSLRKVDFERYFLDTQLITVDPVQTVNTAFNLKDLNIVDVTSDLFKLIRKLFRNPSNQNEYLNKLYSYTHIVIASTRYYQSYIDAAEYDWIFRFFNKEIENILKLNAPDIIAEIGVCYKLRYKKHKNINKIKEYIINLLKKDEILVRRKKDINNIESVEHRNVLAILLLSDFKTLYKGPVIK